MQISYWGLDYWISSLLWHFYLLLHTLLAILVSHFSTFAWLHVPSFRHYGKFYMYVSEAFILTWFLKKFQIEVIFENFKYGAEMKAHIVMQMSWTVRPKWLIKYEEINKKVIIMKKFNSLNPNMKSVQYGFLSILWICSLKGY